MYTEACKLTAYICKKYNINPLGYVSFNGVNVPTILCHQDSYKLGLGSNHGDVYHWFNRYGKTMDNVRNDVSKLLGGGTIPSGGGSSQHSSGAHPMLQKGDYSNDVRELQEKLVSLGYDVGGIDGDFGKNTYAAVINFQSKNGLDADGIVGTMTWAAIDKAIAAKQSAQQQPNQPQAPTVQPSSGNVKAGDVVSIVSGATYYNGKAIPGWVASTKWVVDSVSGDRAVVNASADGKYKINSPINVKSLQVVYSSQTTEQPTQKPVSASTVIEEGDTVNFTGSVHYISAGAKSGGACKPGKAKVTKIYKLGVSAHPYHLVAIAGGGATVHGWVDENTVQKV